MKITKTRHSGKICAGACFHSQCTHGVCMCRWPFLQPQQQVFIASLLDLKLTGVARSDISFVSATLAGSSPPSQTRRLLSSLDCSDSSCHVTAVSRTLQEAAAPADDGAPQSVTAIFNIQTPSAAATYDVATQLYIATSNGSLSVSSSSKSCNVGLQLLASK